MRLCCNFYLPKKPPYFCRPATVLPFDIKIFQKIRMFQKPLAFNFKFFAGLTAIFYVIYIVVRAVQIPITHDEATSVILSQNSYLGIVFYDYTEGWLSANNHILNTISMRFFKSIFSETPLVFRLGNLLAGVFYLFLGYILVRQLFQKPLIQVCAFLIWLSNPYLAEFFSLARGYGMAATFEAAALVFGVLYFDFLEKDPAKSRRFFRLACLSAALAVYSNFTVLYFFMAFCGLFFWHFFQNWRTNFGKIAWLSATAAGLAALIYIPISKIKTSSDFIRFGNLGFYQDTVKNFADCWLTGKSGADVFSILISGIFLLAFCLFCSLVFKNRGRLNSQIWLLALLPATVFCNLVLVKITGSSYLTTRTTLMFSPLIISALFAIARHFEKQKNALVIGLAAVAIFNFFRCANFSQSYEWAFDRDNLTILDYLEKQHAAEKKDGPYSIAVWCLQHPSFRFYQKYAQPNFSHLISEPRDVPPSLPEPLDSTLDFYFMQTEHLSLLEKNYAPVWKSEDGKRVLLQKMEVEIYFDPARGQRRCWRVLLTGKMPVLQERRLIR